jgi:hypothetical protein
MNRANHVGRAGMLFSALRHPIPIRRRVRHDIHRAP